MLMFPPCAYQINPLALNAAIEVARAGALFVSIVLNIKITSDLVE